MRVIEHPILGKAEKRKKIEIMVDDKIIRALEGEPIAAALIASGIKTFKITNKKREPRGVFCAIGLCTSCAMIVNGKPNVRTCVTPVKEGMKIETRK